MQKAISNKQKNVSKASGAYHLREFCGGGNSEPNNTLKNQMQWVDNITANKNISPPVSKGGIRDQKQAYHYHHGEGVVSQRAWWVVE